MAAASRNPRMHLWPPSVAAPAFPAAAPGPAPQQRPHRPDRLSTLPLELTRLVLAFADPPSLLALSCTSRAWHAHLRVHRARSADVWAGARGNYPMLLPLLQSDLRGEDGEGEVLLARLIGGWACQVCDATADQDGDADFDARVRLCAGCRGFMMKTVQQLSDAYFHLHPNTLESVFRTSGQDMDNFHNQFEYKYFTPDVLAVSAYLYLLEAEALAAGRSPEVDVAKYLQRRQALRRRVHADAQMLTKWVVTRRQKLEEIEEEKLARRHQAVFEKLEALGFEEDQYEELFCCFEVVRPEGSQSSETSSVRSEREWLDEQAVDFIKNTDPLVEDDEWFAMKDRIVAWIKRDTADRERWIRIDCQLFGRGYLEPFYALVKACVNESSRALFPPLDSFLRLPSVKAVWVNGDYYGNRFTRTKLRDVFPHALADSLEAIRNDHLTLFYRLARVLSAEGDPLPPSVQRALLSPSPSPFIAQNPRLGLRTPSIPAADLSAVLARATALFQCGLCGLIGPYGLIVPHVQAAQGARAPPRCLLVSASVRGKVRRAAGAEASVEECEERGRVWEVFGGGDDGEGAGAAAAGGGVWKLKGQTWAEVMQRNFRGVTDLKLGRTLRRPSAEGPGAAAAVAQPDDAEKKKTRVLSCFDLGDAAVATYVCE